MPNQDYRIEKDSLGEVRVPGNALYMAQTQRAVENFPISGLRFGRSFIRALGLIKSAATAVSQELGLMDGSIANAIRRAAAEVIDGRHDDQFPIDIFQTGSGTSTNMNANEVIAARAQQLVEGAKIHPNDHVNVCQSSNDVIPAAIHVAAVLETQERLLPALRHLHGVLVKKARETNDVVKTGTHLMDAMPLRSRNSMIRSTRTMTLALASFLILSVAVSITKSQSSLVLPVEDDAIRYLAPPKDDPVARLQQRLNRGEAELEYTGPGGYLLSVLKQLQISVSSQMLVFSKTSFQPHRIGPETPRAIYFNDSAYIGWVQGGDVLEVSAVDPERGAMFYSLDQKKGAKPRFVRREECLQCHASPKTLGVPGHLVRSVFPDREGFPQLQAGSFLTDHSSPLKERWGGWYVTGTHGAQRHLGNVWVQDLNQPDRLDTEAGANVTHLGKLVQLSAYPTADSDLVALMVLEHQTRLHNLLTRANWETRLALTQQADMNRILGEPPDHWSDSTRRRVQAQVGALLKYMLFAEEAALTEPVSGTSKFQKEFPLSGPRDRQGRSLRDFDLKQRLFRYRCSFLIYSEAFDALPAAAKDDFYRRLWNVLRGEDKSAEFASLSKTDRREILEILLETKSGLPEYWNGKRFLVDSVKVPLE